MSEKILVLNCGSSSIKFELFDMPEEKVYFKGLVEKIGEEAPRIKYKAPKNMLYEMNVPAKDHEEALSVIFKEITLEKHEVLKDINDIKAVGHRVVHGAEKFSGSVVINDDVIKSLEECTKFAPLHNPPNITGINICKKLLGEDIPMVGVYDTAFHQQMPKEAYLYALPYEIYEKQGIRRYGFHGSSHRYVSEQAAKLVGKPYDSLKIVTCHLGNGSSIAAIKDGHSVDTSMGHTPLEGLMMGTRCGDIDPEIVVLLAKDKDNPRTIDEVDKILNKKSGVAGISGIGNDMREIEDAMATNERAKLAFDMFVYRIRKYIGSYIAALGGCDAIVFTGGIGENSPLTRSRALQNLDFMGIELDEVANEERCEKEMEISTKNSKTKVYIIRTYEELVIARDTYNLVK